MDPVARRLGLYLALGGLMVVLDTTVTVVALPTLTRELHVGLPTVQWTTTAYALALVAVLPTAAWAAGRFGPRRTYLTALAVFTAGSVLSGLAWDSSSLVLFRVVQGLGGGLLNPIGMSLALAAVPAGQRGRIMSLLGLPVLVGPLLGPVLGGVLIDHASWRWIFFVNLPVGVAAVLAGRHLLPTGAVTRPGPLDVIGLLMLCPGLTLLVLGLSQAGGGLASLAPPHVFLPAAAGAVLTALFCRRAWRRPDALLRLTVLRDPAMAAGALTLTLFGAAYFGSALIGPAYVQLVRGDNATLAGVLGVPQALVTGLALQVATRLVDRVQPRLIVRFGITTALLGTGLRALVLTDTTPYPLIAALGALTGLGVGAVLMPTVTAATRTLVGTDLPSATTVLNIVSQTSVALGTALVAAVLTLLINLYTPELHGMGVTALPRLNLEAQALARPSLAHAARLTLAVPTALMALAALTSRRLPTEPHPPSSPPRRPSETVATGRTARR